jgi:hypothetical protein
MKLVSTNVIVKLLKNDENKESLPDTGEVFAALSSILEKKDRMSEQKEKGLESPVKISGGWQKDTYKFPPDPISPEKPNKLQTKNYRQAVIDTEPRSPARSPNVGRSGAFKMAQTQRAEILDGQKELNVKGRTPLEGCNETNKTRHYHRLGANIENVRVDQTRPFKILKKNIASNANARKGISPTSPGVAKGRKPAFPMEKTETMTSRMSIQQQNKFFEKIPTLYPKRDHEVAP